MASASAFEGERGLALGDVAVSPPMRCKTALPDEGSAVVDVFLVGLGSVNQSFLEMVMRKAEALGKSGIHLRIVGVATGTHGCVRVLAPAPAALSPRTLLAVARAGGDVAAEPLPLAGTTRPQDVEAVPGGGWDAAATCGAVAESVGEGCTVVVEAIPSETYDNGGLASMIAERALSAGIHVVSANKAPVACGDHLKLKSLAEAMGVQWRFESAVMDGVPVFNAARHGLLSGLAYVLKIEGALNSTTTLVLSEMQKGKTMEQGLDVARARGIVEADPSADIDGLDAAAKIAALATVLMDAPTHAVHDVTRTGIGAVDADALALAESAGQRVRLIARAERRLEGEGGGVRCSVSPELVAPGSPFYDLVGADAALVIHTDCLGPVVTTSRNPTTMDTAFGLFSDMIACVKGIH